MIRPEAVTVRDLVRLAGMCMKMGVVFECRMIPVKKEGDKPEQDTEKTEEGKT